jgi:hypothetical protein
MELTQSEKREIWEIINYLLTHNKNLTKTQYYNILDLATIIKKLL